MRSFALSLVVLAGGCASLIGLDDVDRVPCVGAACLAVSGTDGSSGGNGGGEGGGR